MPDELILSRDMAAAFDRIREGMTYAQVREIMEGDGGKTVALGGGKRTMVWPSEDAPGAGLGIPPPEVWGRRPGDPAPSGVAAERVVRSGPTTSLPACE